MSTLTLKQLPDRLPAAGPGEPPWLATFRRRARDDFQRQGLPGIKTEDWKYTSLRKLLSESLLVDEPQTESAVAKVPEEFCDRDDLHLVVLVNGVPDWSLSRLERLPTGVRLQSLGEAIAAGSDAVEALLGSLARHDRHPFAALNGAGFRDGLWLDLAPGVEVERPLVLLWLTTGEKPALSQPRFLMQSGAGARLTLLEVHRGGPRGHLVNQLAEISVAENTNLTHLHLQHTARDRLIRGSHVRCNRDSRYRSLSVDLGGALVRNDLVVGIDGPGAEVTADGLFIAAVGEHVDNHIRIDHRFSHGHSQALYKGLLARGGRAVFNGKLIVHPDARKTDARQVNHNLLLSRDVEIDAKPELEIYNDDVKCSHGCTTGELEADQLFYLRSRGIESQAAAALLVRAFAREISDSIDNAIMRQLVETAIDPVLERVADQGEPG